MKRIKVTWTDAVIYSRHSSDVNKLPKMETEGFLYRDKPDYIVIKKPRTTKLRFKPRLTKKLLSIFVKKPTYLYLPRTMIDKIDNY